MNPIFNDQGEMTFIEAWSDQQAASEDPEIADFVHRARDFWPAWRQALEDAEPDYFARGCGWR